MTNSIRDITEQSGCIFIIGSNTTEQHPVIGIKIRRAARRRGAKLIVADPRRIDIADYADLHLRHTPGTDHRPAQRPDAHHHPRRAGRIRSSSTSAPRASRR